MDFKIPSENTLLIELCAHLLPSIQADMPSPSFTGISHATIQCLDPSTGRDLGAAILRVAFEDGVPIELTILKFDNITQAQAELARLREALSAQGFSHEDAPKPSLH